MKKGKWFANSTKDKKSAAKQGKKASAAGSNLKALYAKLQETTKQLNMKNPVQSVGLKLFLIIFSAILVCVLVVGLSSYSTSKSIIKKKVSESNEVAILQSTGKLNLMFQNFEDLTMQIMLDNNVQDQLNIVRSAVEDYERFQATMNIGKMLQSYVVGNQSIVSTNMIAIDGSLPPMSVGNTISSAQSEEWFKQVLAADGKVSWIGVRDKGLSGSSSNPTLGLARVIKNTTTNEGKFVLVMEFNVNFLAKQLEDLQLGEGSRVSIVDSSSNIIYDEDLTLVGKPSAIVLPEGSAKGTLEGKGLSGENVLAFYDQFEVMDWRLLGTVPVEHLVKDAGQIKTTTWIIAAIAALLAIAIGLFVIRIVAMPLIRLRNLMNEGALGNLNVRADNKSKDEIGQLASSFNQMMEQITTLVKQTTQSATEVLQTAGELAEASKQTAASAKEIAVATEEIAGGATSLAVESERGSDLTGEIEDQMKQVLEDNVMMGRSAKEVERASVQGADYMNVLISKTGATEEMTRSMVDKVDRLKESTNSIRKILEVLQSLTKQTNILSLNATIEAARAGAAGKGFMVVADEIRKLADQSKHSIDVVGQITITIQHEVEETVRVLTEAYPMFQEQIVSVKDANEIFLSVQTQMSQFVDKLESVTASVGTLEQSQKVLAEAMGNVSAVAEESSATSEEVASLSHEQTRIAEGLVRLSDKLETVSNGLSEALQRFRT